MMSMDTRWSQLQVVQEVRRQLGSPFFSHRQLVERVDLIDDDVRVVLRHVRADDRLYEIRFSLSNAPYGASTGEVCQSVQEWGVEVAVALDEVIGTRDIDDAEVRSETDPDGIVLLRWWQGESWSL
jgi:hypothetical protein